MSLIAFTFVGDLSCRGYSAQVDEQQGKTRTACITAMNVSHTIQPMGCSAIAALTVR